MAAAVTVMAFGLLIFSVATPGFGELQANAVPQMKAAVGDDVSLLCSVNATSNVVTQIEWKKLEEEAETKLLVYSTSLKKTHNHRANVSLWVEQVEDQPIGFHLQLPSVTRWDGGHYVCELSTFPDGSMKMGTLLLVTDHPVPVSPPVLQLSASVIGEGQGVREGDQVKILCTSDPPADNYTLWPVKSITSRRLRQDGLFEFPNVSRGDGGLYVCQPEWSSSPPPFRDRNASVVLTVHYLDALDCNTNGSVEVTSGQNVTISCGAEASGPLRFTWDKDNVTVSNSSFLLLPDVTCEDAGMYTVSVTVDHQLGLQRQAVVNVTVRTTVAPTSPDLADLTSSVTATSEPVRISISSALPADVTWTATQRERLSAANTVSPDNASAGRSDDVTSSWDRSSTSSAVDGFAFSSAPSIVVPGPHDIAVTSPGAPADPERNHGRVLWIIFPVLALAVLVTVLLVRYRIQRRMDLPPPFKPPPPPVKYTSVRAGGYVGVPQD
ncbi:carcinoembryonic antigen-related cell adhesion molecule 2-like [Arapaima gigas]